MRFAFNNVHKDISAGEMSVVHIITIHPLLSNSAISYIKHRISSEAEVKLFQARLVLYLLISLCKYKREWKYSSDKVVGYNTDTLRY